MAAPIIKIKRSAIPGKIPNTTSLPLGEFGINTYDGKVYIQQDQGAVGVGSTVIVVNPWSVGLGSDTYNTYFTAGSVGIGTTIPTEALTVVGVVSATSFIGNGSFVVGGRWTIGASGSSAYTFTGVGFTATTNNPILYLARGKVYEFVITSGASHPFQIRTSSGGGAFNNGVTNNGAVSGVVRFEIPFNAPDTLFYQCTNHSGMGNTIFVLNTSTFSGDYGDLTNTPTNLSDFSNDVGFITSFTDTNHWEKTNAGIHTLSNVGIGTTNPEYKLQVDGETRIGNQTSGSGGWLRVSLRDGTAAPAAATISMRSTASSSEAIPVTQPNLVLNRGSDTLGTLLQFKNNRTGYAAVGSLATGNDQHDLRIYTGIGTEVIRVTSNGNTGINTTNPTSKLDVVGDARVTGVVTATAFVGDGSGLTGISAGGSGVVINDDGVLVGTASTIDFGANLSVTFGSGIATITASGGGGGGESYWVETGVGIHTLSNVGIGTTNPTSALTVVGAVSATSFVGDGSGLTGVTASGVASVEISDTAPVGPNAGDLWYNSILGRLFIYYEDVDSDQWVDAAPFNSQSGGSGGATVSVGSLPPPSPSSGDLWYSTIKGRLFIWYVDVDSSQWVDAAPFNSTSASIIDFPTGDYGDLSTTTIDAFSQNIGDIPYDCLTYPPGQLISYDLGLVS
jgi:hypothetical protein